MIEEAGDIDDDEEDYGDYQVMEEGGDMLYYGLMMRRYVYK